MKNREKRIKNDALWCDKKMQNNGLDFVDYPREALPSLSSRWGWGGRWQSGKWFSHVKLRKDSFLF